MQNSISTLILVLVFLGLGIVLNSCGKETQVKKEIVCEYTFSYENGKKTKVVKRCYYK